MDLLKNYRGDPNKPQASSCKGEARELDET